MMVTCCLYYSYFIASMILTTRLRNTMTLHEVTIIQVGEESPSTLEVPKHAFLFVNKQSVNNRA